MDPTLQACVAFWLRPKAFSLADIKMECKSNGLSVTGNKKVLALRLSMKNLPADVEDEGYTITKCSPNKHGGKRTKTESYASSNAANNTANKKQKSNNVNAENPSAKKTTKTITKMTPSREIQQVPVEDANCNECKKNMTLKCEGSKCNKTTIVCDCNDYGNDGNYKRAGVVYDCGECCRVYCRQCRLRYGGDCTGCVLMAE